MNNYLFVEMWITFKPLNISIPGRKIFEQIFCQTLTIEKKFCFFKFFVIMIS